MKNFLEMSADDRDALIEKIGSLIKESGLTGIEMKLTRQCICPLALDTIEDVCSLTIDK